MSISWTTYFVPQQNKFHSFFMERSVLSNDMLLKSTYQLFLSWNSLDEHRVLSLLWSLYFLHYDQCNIFSSMLLKELNFINIAT